MVMPNRNGAVGNQCQSLALILSFEAFSCLTIPFIVKYESFSIKKFTLLDFRALTYFIDKEFIECHKLFLVTKKYLVNH